MWCLKITQLCTTHHNRGRPI
ncbi:tyrosine recombinase, partial [Escherichia coli]